MKITKRVLSMLLALTVVLSFCAVPAFADGETVTENVVAKINETEYTSFGDALKAVHNNETIAIQKDFGETATYTVTDKEFTIDLCGHTISAVTKNVGTAQAFYIGLLGESKLTIIDSSEAKTGKISFSYPGNSSPRGFELKNNSSLFLKGVTLEVAKGTNSKMIAVYMTANSTLDIQDSKINAENNSVANGTNNAIYGTNLNASASVTIKNSELVSNGVCIGLGTKCKINISNSTIETKSKTIFAVNASGQQIVLQDTVIKGKLEKKPAANSEIIGGEFSHVIPPAYLKDNTYVVQNDMGMYIAREATEEEKANAEVKIGNVYYKTIYDAINSLGTGTIVALKDLDLTTELSVISGMIITLDLNGKHVVVSNISDDAQGAVLVSGTFTVKDTVGGGILETGNGVAAPVVSCIISSSACFNLESGTIKRNDNNTAGNYVIVNGYKTAYVNINGGIIENNSNSKSLIKNIGTLNINNGQMINGAGIVENTKTVNVKGGTFSSNDVEAFVTNGYEIITNDDGTYTVKLITDVASVNGVIYDTLPKAVEAANAGDTVTLLTNMPGDGVVIDKDITIDFGGHTYTVSGNLVGSGDNKTIAFQLLAGKDSSNPVKVTLKNGTITTSKAYMSIQNYADLTLSDMKVELTRTISTAYTLSNNNGHVILTGNTNIIKKGNGYAMDVCSNGDGYPSVIVELDENMTGTINGNIEISDYSNSYKGNDKFNLIIKNGTVTGKIVDRRTNEQKKLSPEFGAISGGTFGGDVSEYVADGCETVSNDDGTYTVVEKPEEAKLFDQIVVLRGTTPWLFAAVDSLDYDKAGFKMTIDGVENDVEASIICDSVKSNNDEVTAENLGGKYLFGIKLDDTYRAAFSAVPYVDSYKGTATYFDAAKSSTTEDTTTAE